LPGPLIPPDPLSPAFDPFQTGFDSSDRIQFGFVTTVNPVPLPRTLPLFATGLGVMGLIVWRRKRMAAVDGLAVA
jgi:hypothetical protein